MKSVLQVSEHEGIFCLITKMIIATLVRNLACLYYIYNHTTCFDYIAIFRCVTSIKMLKILIILYTCNTPEDGYIAETCSVVIYIYIYIYI
jgi:hypothetical protein